ncbi:MAG: S8 family serine peptidase [Candidatus Omnitrophica bacterium]|nr:S8 family serine peptidase [Candidatus Omnitrophota bacterium]
MRTIFAVLFSLFCSGTISWRAAAQEESLLCRGHRASFSRLVNALAVEIAAKSQLDLAKEISSTPSETLYRDVRQGRFAFRFDSKARLEALQAILPPDTRFFPVFQREGSTLPTWTFGEVIVQLVPGAAQGALGALKAEPDLEIVQTSRFDPGLALLRTKTGGKSIFGWAAELSARPGVLWAEPNFFGGVSLSVADPFRSNQAHLDIIDADAAWAVTQGDPGVVVAVIDEGVDRNHPDLAANIYQNPQEILDGIDNDGNGFIDDLTGWDFAGNDPDPSPSNIGSINAHGTAVSGVIAAIRENGIGVAGVAPLCRILPCQLFGAAGYAGDFQASEAIRYAANYADVLNGSWGGTGVGASVVMDAIDYAVKEGRGGLGCAVFFASGNGNGLPVEFPANYPWAVGVGETNSAPNRLDLRHEESNFDSRLALVAPQANWTLDISGPGGFDNPTLDVTGGFGGTSSSTPVAAAVAALVLSKDPTLSGPQAVLKVINSCETPMMGIAPNDRYGKSVELGYGRVNAARAVLQGQDYIDDRLEPNDSPGDAAPLERGFHPWLYLGDNPDFYRVPGVAGQNIRCSIQFLNLFGGLDFHLLDESGRVVATSQITANQNTYTGTLDFIPTEDGDFFLSVFPSGGAGAPYTLEIEATPAPDPFEPNQTLLQAAPISPGSGISIPGLSCNDLDLFRVNMVTGEYLYALLSFAHSEANLSLRVLDPAGNSVRSSDLATFGESVDPYQAVEDGDHYIEVANVGGKVNREYTLHAALTSNPPLSGPGMDDIYEENDTVATAASLAGGYHRNLSLDDTSGEVRDVFKFTAPPRKAVRVTIGWQGPQDIDLFIYGSEVTVDPPNTRPLARSIFVGQDRESVHVPARPTSEEYYVDIVRVAGGGQTWYQLGIEFLDEMRPPLFGFLRFSEGQVGLPISPAALSDWRGPLFSHAPAGDPGLGNWVPGPEALGHPGSDGLAVDTSMGGFVFPGNGDRGEFRIGDRDFTLWVRMSPRNSATRRTIAGMPGVWEFFIRPDNTLEFSAGSGPGAEVFGGSGLPVIPGRWQDVACVWDRTGGAVRVFSSAQSGLASVSAPIGARTIAGVQDFRIGASTGGIQGLGLIEQVRFHDSALSQAEIARFSSGPPLSSHDHWNLFQ